MERGFWKNLAKPIVGLAPMDGVTDAAFRFMIAKYGRPSVIFTEFTNVEALSYGAVKALAAFIYDQSERPIVAQIYGVTPEAFYKACFVACELGFDGIDINMGCPSKSVSGNGGGAALIKTPELASEIIRQCQQAVADWANGRTFTECDPHPHILQAINELKLKSGLNPERRLLPISIKTRIGYDQIITEDWIKILLEHRPANISLHGRTLRQMYAGQANWEEIAKAARLVHSSGLDTTLLGNGDVKSLTDAREKITTYGVDGVLIGRATFGEPWIFQGISKSIDEKLQIAIEHCRKYEEIFCPDRLSADAHPTDTVDDHHVPHEKIFAPMKKHLGWYCTGFPNAKELRMKLMACNSADEVNKVIIENHVL